MKKTFFKQLIYALAIIFSLMACEQETSLIDNNTENISVNNLQRKAKPKNEVDDKLLEYIKEYSGKQVKSNFLGRIIDENDQPIKGAKVIIGNQVKETDENGMVSFTSVIVQEYFAYIQAFAEGYLDGSRVIVPNFDKGNQNNFTIKLFKFKSVGRIDSKKGGKVSFKSEKGEGAIYFNSGFTDESGNVYTGDVAVSVNYLNPLNPDTANTMPGDLYGITENFEQVALGSYGMVQVELRGTSGEKLQIIDPAKLIMPIHPDQVATATNQVPMWSFNETAGVWYEETIAEKDGNHYVAEVSHFSFWNCDAPFPVVNFSATVVDASTLNPITGLRVEITYSGFTRYATTNANGIVSGKVPQNQTMEIKILDSCGNVLYIDPSFGPFATTTNITIPVTLSPLQTFTLSGTVNDCLGSPVTNGYVTLSSASGQHIAGILVTAGTYSYTGIGCVLPSNITITGVDLTTAQSLTTVTTVNSGTNTENLILCGGLASEYIRYRVNTTTGPYEYDLIQPYGGIRSSRFYLSASNTTSGTFIFGNTLTVGFGYPFGTIGIEKLGHVNGINPSATMALANPMTFDLVAITTGPGGIGQYISVDFSGNYVDNNGNTNTIEGEARIFRDF
ncbi:carboxypeptidase-like regulatory domain-containing protein [Tenacibaculum agarivorans]|uniref:carboxypeptidase-like regulatory domain-containing protein n=1 Tax=Tenacibaculum agarivorans TaxID=1908389 RepID=UPI00094B84B0|nr:carboxypeptidase-like regulatory domain-containing protein [Tenacibaculum agarivorans]